MGGTPAYWGGRNLWRKNCAPTPIPWCGIAGWGTQAIHHLAQGIGLVQQGYPMLNSTKPKTIRWEYLPIFATMVGACLNLTGCKNGTKPAQSSSSPDAVKMVGLSFPPSATNIRQFSEALFTLTAVISADMPYADISDFLGRNAVLPGVQDLKKSEKPTSRLTNAGRAAPWWDLTTTAETSYGEFSGKRQRGKREYIWQSAVAIVPLDADRSRIYIVYIEEASVEP